MHLTHTTRRAAGAALILILTALAVSACGSSSSKTTSVANAAATGTATTGTGTTGTGTTGAAPARGARFAALRECLEKQGITLPQAPAGQRPRGALGLLGGGGSGFKLPSGVTRAQYEAALKHCGADFPRGGAGGFARLRTPAFEAGLKKFAACMRSHGVNVPEPNTSGKGPIFGTSGLDTQSAQFKAAETACAGELRASFGRGPGAPAGAPGTGAAPGTTPGA